MNGGGVDVNGCVWAACGVGCTLCLGREPDVHFRCRIGRHGGPLPGDGAASRVFEARRLGTGQSDGFNILWNRVEQVASGQIVVTTGCT
jgi:hypothetical protein